ncbi:hypothetical protein JOQ06_025740 [Pogonophryne albipinna]|uniref:Ephrin RBD domain-containing protein n=1 Tax=Pogonophryne albipinna TaxID=1090488 RepID=A0AAD6FE63_9TELE|nr:hypothetical protein JOQ06_025740 [Pogonophryne albipinna]
MEGKDGWVGHWLGTNPSLGFVVVLATARLTLFAPSHAPFCACTMISPMRISFAAHFPVILLCVRAEPLLIVPFLSSTLPPSVASTLSRLTAGDMSIQVNLNDYLDIYCPHYPNKRPQGSGQPEELALYLVGEASFQGCVETRGAIKRWECNTPYAPFGPVRFSEKIQRFTPFSLGFEFLPGRHYYYSFHQTVLEAVWWPHILTFLM